MRDQIDAVTDLIDTAHIPYTCAISVQGPAPDADITKLSFIDTEKVLTASLSHQKRSAVIQRKESVQSIRMIVVRVRQNTCIDLCKVYSKGFRIL